ncbi:3alpha(or 20beta)-hydroxysteroid dehydrogenase [Amycolatopsis bartoniae]|uniref:3-alpha-hydroxysteroid dehydrogenase n=1 Tax=Amycolatopsis bartoniae TaxID=941986 RepID=A0A8H9MBZ0_9PSEU|nr:glucose 1-dehydrogenase [Amycolatopsis bartoniae]MBB2936526.1 3alpha(or 20beta)-hydroxysteroid dehydrogenase [Amycolatopsis bartoniae]TVT10999.1 glucose 1-dehydrogenase [Amycolatopsis bartoniae]GHF68289.1 3-alpha-hydroxysteroid dehydrogenase [Amycolatopsis bartoniae]
MVNHELDGQVAIVTGGARGIGAAIVRALTGAGATAVIAGGRDTDGKALAGELGDRAAYERHDVGCEQSWDTLLERTTEQFGPPTILVNNAGIYRPGADVTDTTPENFDEHYRVNQRGTFLGMRTAAAAMKDSGGGVIVNISSIASHRPYPNQIAYSTTKWAVRGMTKCAAVELGAHNIRVNSVHPGFIDTTMLDAITDEWNAQVIAATPLGRRGLAEEVAATVLFLVSPAGGFITGAEFVVDGGLAS